MTNKEAKEKLYIEWQKFLEHNLDYAGISEAYKMAFKALEQESCTDAISRQAVLKVYEDRFIELQKAHLKDTQLGINWCINTLKDMPSVKPQEPTDENLHREREQFYMLGYEDASKRFRQEPCKDAISRQAVLDEAFEVDTKEHGRIEVVGVDAIDALPSVTPQPKTGHWILADEQNKEDIENDNYRFICSECQCSDIHAKGTIVPYCWKCGHRMVEPQERNK